MYSRNARNRKGKRIRDRKRAYRNKTLIVTSFASMRQPIPIHCRAVPSLMNKKCNGHRVTLLFLRKVVKDVCFHIFLVVVGAQKAADIHWCLWDKWLSST